MTIFPSTLPAPQLRDVTLRDGLQDNTPISVDTKYAIFEGLIAAGIRSLEIGSFVREDRVPAMAGTAELAARTAHCADDIERWALVLNKRGLELAVDAGLRHFQYVVSVSDAHSINNAGRPAREALDQLRQAIEVVPEGAEIELTLATSFGCPFDGPVSPTAVLDLLTEASDLPLRAVNIADTIGTAMPNEVEFLLRSVRDARNDITLGIHLHDTRGLGLTNALAAYRAGVDRIDAGLGGLGGCPFAPGASGNVPAEDLVHMFHESGVNFGVDLEQLVATATLACNAVGVPVRSHIGEAGPRFAKRY